MQNRTVVAAFFAVYVIWGSTYLAIRYGIETLPPWTLTMLRFSIAGALMWIIAWWRGEGRLTPQEKRVAIYSGLLLIPANGGVCMAEQYVSSGVAAVVAGSIPIWILLFGWLWYKQSRPSPKKILGACLGLMGIGIIASDNISIDRGGIGMFAPLFVLVSSWLWTFGTLVQVQLSKIKSPFLFSAQQMLYGSLAATLVSFTFEKPWAIAWSQVSMESVAALIYLIVFGSIVAFSAYSWLTRNVEPHLVSTYALVNPLIAVILGAIFYKEPLEAPFMVGAVLVLLGLALIVLRKRVAVRENSSKNFTEA